MYSTVQPNVPEVSTRIHMHIYTYLYKNRHKPVSITYIYIQYAISSSHILLLLLVVPSIASQRNDLFSHLIHGACILWYVIRSMLFKPSIIFQLSMGNKEEEEEETFVTLLCPWTTALGVGEICVVRFRVPTRVRLSSRLQVAASRHHHK